MSFGLDNLPYGVVDGRCVVRYGDAVLPLDRLDPVFAAPTLNGFLARGRAFWEATREQVTRVLEAGSIDLLPLAAPPPGAAAPSGAAPPSGAPAPSGALAPSGAAAPSGAPVPSGAPSLPVAIGDFVDFYSSLEHASNLGRRFRPDGEPLLENWRHLPVGYHGRAGSVVVSGTPIARPVGQRPTFGPTAELDIELELGFVTGGAPATRIAPADVREHVFGFVLVNDWSARDLQRWEYRPLGPFTAKSFATSISPWIVPLTALEPYLVPAREQEPEPLPYLRTRGDWALDIALEVELNGTVISRGNARGLYWTFPQLLAHATVNGAAARPGDLFASGTISGASPGSEGSLIELGLPFLADGDTVVLRGRAGSVSLGEVSGTVVPATTGG